MAGKGHRAGNRPRPETDGQPVDTGRQRRAVGFRRGFDIVLGECQRFRPAGPQAQHLDPEPGIHIVEPRREQPDDMRRIACRGRQFEPANHHFAIDAPQPQF